MKITKCLTMLLVLALCSNLRGEELGGKPKAKKEPTSAEGAYALLKEMKVGMISTVRKNKPFVSIMPYILDDKGRPVVFISDLAQHTDRIKNNPNISMMATRPDKDGDIFNGPRVTLTGKMVKVTNKERKKLQKLYLKRYKEAKVWINFGDFNFYRMEIDDIYYIAGFGDIGWVDLDKYKKVAEK